MKITPAKFQALLSVFLFILTANCATLPREERQVTNVFPTTVTKAVAYERANLWFVKSLGNANLAIQLRDAEQGRIVTNGYINCTGLNGISYGIAEKQNVDFFIDFTAKDNKVRVIFGDIKHSNRASNGAGMDLGPSSQDQIQDIDKTCFEPLRSDLIKTIEGRSTIAPSTDF